MKKNTFAVLFAIVLGSVSFASSGDLQFQPTMRPAVLQSTVVEDSVIFNKIQHEIEEALINSLAELKDLPSITYPDPRIHVSFNGSYYMVEFLDPGKIYVSLVAWNPEMTEIRDGDIITIRTFIRKMVYNGI